MHYKCSSFIVHYLWRLICWKFPTRTWCNLEKYIWSVTCLIVVKNNSILNSLHVITLSGKNKKKSILYISNKLIWFLYNYEMCGTHTHNNITIARYFNTNIKKYISQESCQESFMSTMPSNILLNRYLFVPNYLRRP